MKFDLRAIAIAVSMLIAGCGGGGGSTSTGATAPGTGTAPTPAVPSTPSLAGVATYSSTRGDYSIARTATGFTVTERRTNSPTTVSGANAIRFADITINLGIGNKALALGSARLNPLIELTMAILNRVPDADTLSAGIDRLQAGQSMTQIADSLLAEAVQAPAVSGYSASMLNSEFVAAVYKNVFRRSGVTAPASTDIEKWASRIDKGGISRGALVLAMLDAARSGSGELATGTVTQLLDNKIAMGDFFAVQQGIVYNSAEEALTRTSAIAQAITATDIAAAKDMIGFADASFNLVASK